MHKFLLYLVSCSVLWMLPVVGMVQEPYTLTVPSLEVEVLQVIASLKDPASKETIVISGPPGTNKFELAKRVACQARLNVLHVDSYALLSVHSNPERACAALNRVFERAKEMASHGTCMIVFSDAEALFKEEDLVTTEADRKILEVVLRGIADPLRKCTICILTGYPEKIHSRLFETSTKHIPLDKELRERQRLKELSQKCLDEYVATGEEARLENATFFSRFMHYLLDL